MSVNEPGLEAAVPGKRVALLARPGPAREHLRLALNEVGATVVLEDDPNTLEGHALDDASPEVVLVALEAAIEDSLSRFDHVLHDPAVVVIFDEADLAARREGWEAKRWARHLAAKLNGHADVLPPGGEVDDMRPEPGLPTSPAQIHAGANIERHLQEAQGIAFELPRGGLELVQEEAGSDQVVALVEKGLAEQVQALLRTGGDEDVFDRDVQPFLLPVAVGDPLAQAGEALGVGVLEGVRARLGEHVVGGLL